MVEASARSEPYSESSGKYPPLREQLPLSGPLTVLVDPASRCNLRCPYCPTGHPEMLAAAGVKRGIMQLPLFHKIIDDLATFAQPVGRLHLYKDGEPLLNPDIGVMIAEAKRRDVARSVELTTNAILLSREKSRVLLASGLDRIRISVQPRAIIGSGSRARSALYDRALKNVRSLWEERSRTTSTLSIHAKTIDFGGDEGFSEKFIAEFSPIADTVHVDAPMSWSGVGAVDFALGSTLVTDMNRSSPLSPGRIVCPQPFYTMAVNHDGRVSGCCVDWSGDVLVGDVREQSLPAIWNGFAMRELRRQHLLGRRAQYRACEKCRYLFGVSQDGDLDDCRQELVKLYSGLAGSKSTE